MPHLSPVSPEPVSPEPVGLSPVSPCAGARDQRGVTTAEYAVATAAGAGFAGLLYKLLSGGFGDSLIKTLFDHVLGLLGLG